jgi:uncharacterized membrane protein
MKPDQSDSNYSSKKSASFFANHHQAIPTAPLPDPIAKNIDAIIKLYAQQQQELSQHQRILENIASFFGSPVFMYLLLGGLIFWITGSVLRYLGLFPSYFPTFGFLDQGIDVASLLISTGVLIRQFRQERFAKQRTQLMLQLNLLSEQKIAKLIELIEELRNDLPYVENRHDPEAEVMQQAADPLKVLEVLQDNLERELANESPPKND